MGEGTVAAPPRALRMGSREIPVLLPRLADPRLHVAATLLSVQVIGQVWLRFELSVAQILVSLGTAGIIELALTYRSRGVLAWPASALLTGNGVALLLRVPGTEHGDWWSLHGAHIFAATAALSLLSKYAIQVRGRPLFNPSNLGLVAAFLILGSQLADPQDLWWGPPTVGLVLAYVIITTSGITITRRLGLLALSAAFFVVLSVSVGAVAASGHCMSARWRLGPVCGWSYWSSLVLSPEILIFLFFMITDPRTVPRGRTARIVFGAVVGWLCALLMAAQTTEYATKVALLAGLVVACAARPLFERWLPAGAGADGDWAWTVRGAGSGVRPAMLAVSAPLALISVLAVSFAAGEPTDSSSADAATGARPSVELSERPTISVSDTASNLGGIGPDDAEAIAIDTVEALLLADRAVARSDSELVEAVAAGAWRSALLDAIDDGSGGAEPVTREIDRAAVDLVHNPAQFQSLPRVAVRLEGSVDGERWHAAYAVASTTAGYVITEELAQDDP